MRHLDEQLGTRDKFWLLDPAEQLWLLKFPRDDRPDVGEIWTEKIASEISLALGIPTVRYEFAKRGGRCGVICKSFVARHSERLVVGNELVGIPQLPQIRDRRKLAKTNHTLPRVINQIRPSFVDIPLNADIRCHQIQRGIDVFVGFLMFDALVAHIDRHETNWGLVKRWNALERKVTYHLAPNYDLASCLGHELFEEKRKSLTDDETELAKYLSNARGKIFDLDGKPMPPIEMFNEAQQLYPDAGQYWLGKLQGLTSDDVDALLGKIPIELASIHARQLAKMIILRNRDQLLGRGTAE
ncbi:MAG TPA: hypothetical protein V6D22_20140 [Candidatus Obscuribacterales bacterium]